MYKQSNSWKILLDLSIYTYFYIQNFRNEKKVALIITIHRLFYFLSFELKNIRKLLTSPGPDPEFLNNQGFLQPIRLQSALIPLPKSGILGNLSGLHPGYLKIREFRKACCQLIRSIGSKILQIVRK